MYQARVCRCETGGCCPRRRPPVPNVCRWRPRRPRRPVWVGLRTARATTQSSRDRPGATGSQGSSGPHRTSRCAASPSGTVLWRRSVWASSRCVTSASPSRPRTGSPSSWTTSSTICTGGWTTPKPRMIGPGPTSPSPRCLPRPVCSAPSVLPAVYSAMVACLSLEALRPGWPLCAGPIASPTGQVLDSYRWLACAARGKRSRGG